MFAAPSSHKRRRASARGDKARKRVPGRVVLNAVAPVEEGQEALDAAHARFRNVVEAHAFNHKVSLVISSSSNSSTPVASLSSIASSAHSLLARISLRVFLAPEFVSQYVKGANLVALSTGSLESDDVVCLDGQGTLILSLTKPTYQVLGLIGRPSRFAIGASGRTGDRKSGPVERYIVEVPLLDPSFVPGKPGWQRVAECFERWEKENGGCFALCFAAEGGRKVRFPEHIGAQSVAEVKVDIEEDTLQDVWVPDLEQKGESSETPSVRRGWQGDDGDKDALPWDDWSEALSELAEWKALVERDAECIKTYHRPNPFDHNSYVAPSPCTPGTVTRITFSGFLHPSTIVAIEMTLREHLDNSSSTGAWAMLSCEGFADSPVRWRSQDPGLGLALGQGKAPVGSSQHEEYEEEDSSGSDDDAESSDSDGDEDDLSSLSAPPLTGKAARRKRSRQVKRKGHQRKGEAERSASIASAAAAGGQGGAFGWSAIVFGNRREEQEGRKDTGRGGGRDARYIWWENVEGDTRS